MTEHLIGSIAGELAVLPFIQGIVLGGSRANGMAGSGADIDIGIYYDKNRLDLKVLNRIVQKLDDERREAVVCPEGEWGDWINCGGGFIVEGCRTNLILRETEQVRKCAGQCEQGMISQNYQAGYPHAYLNVMYRGELAVARVLYSRDDDFLQLKKWVENYPDRLRHALMTFFLFEARFSCSFAKEHAQGEDLYYVAGHLFRAISALNQVLFAYNREYCLNEKKAVARIDTFPVKPAQYSRRVSGIFSLSERSANESCIETEMLIEEAADLCGK